VTAAFDYESLVTASDSGIQRFDAAIDGMTCAACIIDIEHGLRDLPGLLNVRVNYTNRRLALEWRDDSFSLSDAFERLRRMGYACVAWAMRCIHLKSRKASARKQRPHDGCCVVWRLLALAP